MVGEDGTELGEMEDMSDSESDTDDEEEDKDFVRIESQTKVKQKWKVVENHTKTLFTRPKMESIIC